MGNSILRHLEAIIETGSIVAASRKLYLSQPSLSQYVKRLEAEYEIQIFDRSTTPWKLTEEGEILLESQRKIADIERQCRQSFADRKNLRTGNLIIGSTAYRSATLLNPVLSEFHVENPGIMIQIQEGTTEEALQFAEAGQTDCSFVISSMVPGTLASVPVYKESVLFALSPNHPYAKSVGQDKELSEIDFDKISGTPFIIMKRGQIFHEYFYRICSHYRLQFPVALHTQSILTVPSLVASGIGAALIPSTIAEECRDRGLKLFKIKEGILPVNEVSLAWRKDRYQSYAAREFIRKAQKILPPLGAKAMEL